MINGDVMNISPESVAELNTRYTFLNNEIPNLEKRYADLKQQVAAVVTELDKATNAVDEDLVNRQIAIDNKEQQLSFREDLLNEREALLVDREEKASRLEEKNNSTESEIISLLNQDVEKKKELEDIQVEISKDKIRLGVEKDILMQGRIDFDTYRANCENDIRSRTALVKDKQTELNSLVAKNKDLLDSLTTKLIDVENQKNAPIVALADAKNKLDEANAKMAALDSRDAGLVAREKVLSDRETFLAAKELGLKAIKVQLDKKESKVKEIIANNGLQLSDVQL